ncbi:hypothetical protein SK128_013542 [Halocaridina rubra]|uniref:Uncharacterized protein n=1 Tax=Halocaridina rubra TaxID=373956 RepID=A0AAN9A0V4_HALRR
MGKLFLWLTLVTICCLGPAVLGNVISPSLIPNPWICPRNAKKECCSYPMFSDKFIFCIKKYRCLPVCEVPDCIDVMCPAIYCPEPVYKPGGCCPYCYDYEIYEKKQRELGED